MDANKLKVLREIDYKIPTTCETCAASDIGADGWGVCGVHEYKHLKHSELTSFLSVHRSGCCNKHELDENKVAVLGLHAFKEFIK